MDPSQGVHVTEEGYGYDSKGGGIEEVEMKCSFCYGLREALRKRCRVPCSLMPRSLYCIPFQGDM
jgi:hypothetical protein